MSRTSLLALATVAAALVVTVGDASSGASPTAGSSSGGEPVRAVAPLSSAGAGASRAGSGPAESAGASSLVYPAASSPTSPRWQWPLRPRPPVVRPFRAPASAYGPGHRGLDLAAAAGVAVFAVEAGRVVHAGMVAGRGTVSVEHSGGLRSTYEPLAAVVSVGDVVAAGDHLGTIAPPAGVAHCGPEACLHLGARRDADYLDPLPLLAGGRIALLPLG